MHLCARKQAGQAGSLRSCQLYISCCVSVPTHTSHMLWRPALFMQGGAKEGDKEGEKDGAKEGDKEGDKEGKKEGDEEMKDKGEKKEEKGAAGKSTSAPAEEYSGPRPSQDEIQAAIKEIVAGN